MSFSPKTGLVYIPAQEFLGAYRRDPEFKRVKDDFNLGVDTNVFAAFPPEAASGHLLAWDPVGLPRQPVSLPFLHLEEDHGA